MELLFLLFCCIIFKINNNAENINKIYMEEFIMKNKAFLGLETGGTNTRVAITDTAGNLLSYVRKGGGNAACRHSSERPNFKPFI